MKRRLLLATLALVFINLQGCSSWFNLGAPEAPKTGAGNSSLSQPVLEKTTTGIEVTWEVPSEPVDGFVIRYGENKTQMLKEATILLSELRQERDEQYGSVYRYIIRDINSDQPVYVSIAAFKGDVISEFSDAVAETRRAL